MLRFSPVLRVFQERQRSSEGALMNIDDECRARSRGRRALSLDCAPRRTTRPARRKSPRPRTAGNRRLDCAKAARHTPEGGAIPITAAPNPQSFLATALMALRHTRTAFFDRLKMIRLCNATSADITAAGCTSAAPGRRGERRPVHAVNFVCWRVPEKRRRRATQPRRRTPPGVATRPAVLIGRQQDQCTVRFPKPRILCASPMTRAE